MRRIMKKRARCLIKQISDIPKKIVAEVGVLISVIALIIMNIMIIMIIRMKIICVAVKYYIE